MPNRVTPPEDSAAETTPETTPETTAAPDVEPWSISVDLRDACRPNYDLFVEESTEQQRQLLVDLGLTYTADSDDYDIRCGVLEKLSGVDPEEYPGVEDLIEIVAASVCPLECGDCWASEREWILEQAAYAVGEFEKIHPDVMWVVVDWRGDTVCVDEVDIDDIENVYHRWITSGYSDIEVRVNQADGPWGQLSFDRMSFDIHALTDQADKELVRHHYEWCSSADSLDFEPIRDASPALRALMLTLVTDHGDVHLPEYLDLQGWNGEPRRRAYGTLEEADPQELAFLAAPLLALTDQQRSYALTLLPDCEHNWPQLVAAVVPAAA